MEVAISELKVCRKRPTIDGNGRSKDFLTCGNAV